MKTEDVKLALMLAALAGVGYVAWKGYRAAGAVGDALSNAWDSVAAGWEGVKGTLDETFVQPFNAGQAWVDAGQPINTARILPAEDGEWRSDPVAREYDALQAQYGIPPQAVSDSGAAFGVFPQMPRRRTTYTSTVLSDAAANDARRVFAQTDPRRVDLY